MNGYLRHVTRDGDRWDLLANTYYGDPLRYAPIRAANPGITGAVLAAGITLIIPILEEATPSQVGLPPWRS